MIYNHYRIITKKRICTSGVQFCCKFESKLEKMNGTNDASHYQELGALKVENAYQSLKA